MRRGSRQRLKKLKLLEQTKVEITEIMIIFQNKKDKRRMNTGLHCAVGDEHVCNGSIKY